jgi:hypothetical protein
MSKAPGIRHVRRVARPWGFTVSEVAAKVPVSVWHSNDDPEAPIGPWESIPDIIFNRLEGANHEPSAETWSSVLSWSQSLLAAK